MLSLSVRIAESFLSKEKATLSLLELGELALEAGYRGICMRASQVGVHSSPETISQAAEQLRKRKLPVTMVTGDFDIVYNNEKGPTCLQNIEPFLQLAKTLGAPMIRVALKHEDDLLWAQRAADQAREYDLKLVHQCHTLSLFETVDSMIETLKKIDRPNFGLIYEPANLELCGQNYGQETLMRLAPWIFNVYLQNQRLNNSGAITLNTWCRGPVNFDLISVHDAGGIDYSLVFEGLKAIEYDGPVTVHQSAREGESPLDSAKRTAKFLKEQHGWS